MSARDLFKESCAIFCEGTLPWAKKNSKLKLTRQLTHFKSVLVYAIFLGGSS